MIIEIRKAGFINKGAQLMLYACLEKLRAAYPDATFTMAPTHLQGAQPFRKLVDVGMFPKASLYYQGWQLGRLAALVPRKIREMYGVILDRDVDIVIDAAGFSYSDQWGYHSVKELAHSAVRWKKQGTKLILMPQAFGSFTNPKIKKFINIAIANADLVMPREQTSYQYLISVAGLKSNIKQYPDFTNLIMGSIPNIYDPINHRVCLVPNYRMIDKTSDAQSRAYLAFMVNCAQWLEQRKAKPFILIHEGKNDIWLSKKISELSNNIPVLKVDCPLEVKGILGACDATIASRFHALVSALSQGVPSLGTSWSHKYHELFCDYNFQEGIVDILTPWPKIEQKLEMITEEHSHKMIANKLLSESHRLKKSTEDMWKQVLAVIGN